MSPLRLLLESKRARLAEYARDVNELLESVFSLRCSVLRLQGELRGGGGRATVIYAGRGRTKAYLLRAMFERHEILETAGCTVFSVRDAVRRISRNEDAVIADIGWPYDDRFNRDGDHLEVPDWVTMKVSLAPTWEEMVPRLHRTVRNNDLRIIRRA